MEGDPGSSILPELLLILFLILINAFFAAAEMAIVSLNKNKVNLLAEEGNEKAKLLLKLTEEPSRFLSTVQVGITLAGFFASASASASIADNLSPLLNELGIPYSEKISVILITIVLSYITLVFGELFPKRIALQKSETLAMFAVKPIIVVSKLTLPFVKLLSGSTNLLLRIFGINIDNLEEKVSKEEIKSLIEVGQEHGVINETEKEMINGIFEFDNKLAKEVMTPRTEVFLINIDTPIDKVIDDILEEQFSRIPVYEGDIDNIIGILYIKDVFIEGRKTGMEKVDIRKILRPAYFVPETKNIDDLFKELQNTKNHMSILIDEYGGFSGIVSIEDLIEEVMGNIFDEYDEVQQDIKKIDNNTFILDGLLPIDEVNEHLHLDIESYNTDTIGGFVVSLLGSIPKDNDQNVIEYENLIFKIEKVTEKRIEKLRLCIQKEA
ncbi:hemolysin family protein [Clostridium sp. A1-XYC3]|uniref:Hemolysin family protein n=1 Tax=Clostridium tanneri TaxID=3037988 RepID=A0ABU4JWH9_9CLOT|nr:hemolysin family protein [Clostridium sp. A1-XYC3]MDW8802513.1 hemolysin family protein [Clostridium sp. A1-XYC3]